ncbi:alpha/beta fold hydrolase [Kribbella qitaiheensis]|uniref:alpha/beta fold hydrolase n=1 Tax=Kribbella qitaiheensis TaxID=1544730 RepID=UPI00360635AE
MVQDLAATITEPVVAVGHSMVGQGVAHLADQHSELVQTIVVIDSAYGADDAEMARCPAPLHDLRTRGTDFGVEFVDRAFTGADGTPLHLAARTQMAHTPGPVLADLYESMYLTPTSIAARPAGRESLPPHHHQALPQPLLQRVRVAFARTIAWTADSEIEVWPGTTHYLHQQHAAQFSELLKTWVFQTH